MGENWEDDMAEEGEMRLLIGILLMFQLWYGTNNMWFHQDDLNWMKLAQKSYIEQLTIPVTEHINYLFRFMFKTEYELWGWNYGGYLVVSLGLHLATLICVGLLVTEVTKRRELGVMAALIFTINTNWNEVVLWVSGQTISISVLFVILTIYWVSKGERGWKLLGAMLLASITSGLAAWLPITTLLVYGREKRVGLMSLFTLITTIAIYLGASAGVGGEIGRNPILMLQVATLGVVNTVLGRLWWPFEIGERGRMLLTLIAAGWGLFSVKVRELLENKQTLLLIIALVGYYAMVAIGRAQYGVGMMRAERYAYMGLALILPLIFYGLREVRIQYLRIAALLIVVVQIAGFVTRANKYIERPQQLREWHERMVGLDKRECYQDRLLPSYIMGNESTYLSEYASLWEGLKIGGETCREI